MKFSQNRKKGTAKPFFTFVLVSCTGWKRTIENEKEKESGGKQSKEQVGGAEEETWSDIGKRERKICQRENLMGGGIHQYSNG